MIKLKSAQRIVSVVLAHAGEKSLKPLAVVVFDARGAMVALAAQDGVSLHRADIARGKAYAALALGLGSRTIEKMAQERSHFLNAATHAVGGFLIPVAGGVLIRDKKGAVIGAVGVSGDTPDNDEAAASAGIAAAGLVADAGVG